MTVGDVGQCIEQWAPKEIAWEGDNAGLQCGDLDSVVRGILVALDPTGAVVEEAYRRGANLIVTHHPLLFRPLKSITTGDQRGNVIRALMRRDISLYSAHTNLDFTRGGTSFALAEALGLTNTSFLHRPYKTFRKVVTFVPAEDADRVATAMAEAGAGVIGNYDQCSFRLEGTGTFRGNRSSSPRRGQRGVLERVREVRLEMVSPSWKVDAVVNAMTSAHPYEEVAYEVYASEHRSGDYGMGVIGELRSATSLRRFLGTVKRSLGTPGVRFTGDLRTRVRRIAVCGGSGSELIGEAVRNGADVFVTADIKYHGFQEAPPGMALVDAGHFETEFPVVAALIARLKRDLGSRKSRIPIIASRRVANPVQYI